MASVGLQFSSVKECLAGRRGEGERQNITLLLVEDDEEAMLLVQYALEEYGNEVHRMEWARTLTTGLRRLTTGGIDLVILDLGLPESSGVESYHALHELFPHLPVLVLTGDTREHTESLVVSRGADTYLVKDEASGAVLVDAIRGTLSSNPQWRERKLSANREAQGFHLATEQCRALAALGSRLLYGDRAEKVLTCAQELVKVVDTYTRDWGGTMERRATLLAHVERLARQSARLLLVDIPSQLRALISAPGGCTDIQRIAFLRAMAGELDKLGTPTTILGGLPVSDSPPTVHRSVAAAAAR